MIVRRQPQDTSAAIVKRNATPISRGTRPRRKVPENAAAVPLPTATLSLTGDLSCARARLTPLRNIAALRFSVRSGPAAPPTRTISPPLQMENCNERP